MARVTFILLALAIPLHADERLDRIKSDVSFLAGPACEGRGLKTDGIEKAAAHVEAGFKAAGLKPAGKNGSFFQPFSIKETFLEAGPHSLVLIKAKDEHVGVINKDYCVCGVSGKGTVGGGVAFVGYGISSPGKYDDYEGIDVKNKVVIILRQTPRVKSKAEKVFNEADTSKFGNLNAKLTEAKKRGAAAVIFVSDLDMSGKEDPLMGYDYARDNRPGELPVVHAKRSFVDKAIAASGKSLKDLEAQIDKDGKPHSVVLDGWEVKVQTSVGVKDLAAKNVVGYLDGAGPNANETVILGAHYDHLGRGETGTKVLGSTDIHYGADDNASGTSALLELARRYGSQKDRQGRRLVFIAFTGEERGLLGSLHYCEKPLFPLADTVAMLNMDMVGRLRPDDKTSKDRLLVGGVGSAKSFEKLLDAANANPQFDFQLEKSKSGTGPSDHTSFYLAKVPVYFFFTGDHQEYHTPKDKPETINVNGIIKVANLVENLATEIATAKERPEYVPGMGSSMSGGPLGPKLGLMPGYDDAETRGMAVSGVMPGGAAEAAGIKKGDRITAIEGKPVKNVQDYMKVMAGAKRGDPIEITIDRDGKVLKIKATPK